MRYRRRQPLGLIVLLVIVVVVVTRGSEERQPPPKLASPVTARVVRVVDGDTIAVRVGSRLERVRYIGVDTPETVKPSSPVQCFGKRASAFNGRLVGGRSVRLRFDRELRDRYGRLLAYVFVGERFVNAELVRRGYATTLRIPPNDSRAPQLASLERAAMRRGRGLWAACPL